MLLRHCAGGIVFYGDKVFLLKNEKSEWVLPKGVIRGDNLAQDVALARVENEAGITPEIIAPAGETAYEFYSITRKQPVCNRIVWFIMRAPSESFRIAFEQGFQDGGFFQIDKAYQLVTYSQDLSLIKSAYERYKEFR